jgi:hypothetical protein
VEARDLLTGNVVVNLVGGNLTITGDTADNTIYVEQNNLGQFMVLGLDQVTAGKGALQQDGSGLVIVMGQVRNVSVAMHGQYDFVNFYGTLNNTLDGIATPLTISGRLSIDMGSGDSDVRIVGIDVQGATSIRDTGKSAHNTVSIDGSNLHGPLSIRLAGAGSFVSFNYSDIPGLVDTIGAFTFRGTNGADTLVATGSEFRGNVRVDLANGDDRATIGDATFDAGVTILGGPGNDTLEPDSNLAPTFRNPRRVVAGGFETNTLS